MDVLESGPDSRHDSRAPRGARAMLLALVAAVIGIAVLIGGMQWWRAESARPDALEIAGITSLGPFGISGSDLPDGWPRDLVVDAMRLTLDITGDPQRSTRVDPSGDTGSYVAIGAGESVIPAGERATVDVVVIPGDCGSVDAPNIAGPLIDSQGVNVPLSAESARILRSAVISLCTSGAPAPAISPRSARVDVFFRDRTLVMRVRIAASADRVILQPGDSMGFRGLGEQQATIEENLASARLRWLISPSDVVGIDSPTVRVRAFAVSAGRAHPWTLDLRVPEGAAIPAP